MSKEFNIEEEADKRYTPERWKERKAFVEGWYLRDDADKKDKKNLQKINNK